MGGIGIGSQRQSPSRIILARHGMTDWNSERRYLGTTDIPLNEMGLIQAKELGGALAHHGLEAVFCSDLRRTRDTALEVQWAINNTEGTYLPLIPDARLREIDFGAIEGWTYEEAMKGCPDEVTRWYDDPENIPPPGGGETLAMLRGRVSNFMEELHALPYSSVLIVTHGGVINAWLEHIGAKSFWGKPLKHGEWIECG
ncbi:histidine phosphatase family protein [Paenibacillus sp. HN-1]|uniref:histidine phosphatase family protein n=1 Tax=Paenibacillus TaxID=44249 RepID=UPI001CA9EA63|nr:MULTISPECIES: histidine phosphatase family protein [Paenibacillus]MBY9078154.1 histidine phosphatase family protein [Paenibacillus sp. CGMCC 1.18879]MBY9083895.1 histidine phosphatase family protein [Paenibacillus sinensis]